MGPWRAQGSHHIDSAVHQLAESKVVLLTLSVLVTSTYKDVLKPAPRAHKRFLVVHIIRNKVVKNRVPWDTIRGFCKEGFDVLVVTMARIPVLHRVSLVGLAHSVPPIALLIVKPPVSARAVAHDTQDPNSEAQAARVACVAETL